MNFIIYPMLFLIGGWVGFVVAALTLPYSRTEYDEFITQIREVIDKHSKGAKHD